MRGYSTTTGRDRQISPARLIPYEVSVRFGLRCVSWCTAYFNIASDFQWTHAHEMYCMHSVIIRALASRGLKKGHGMQSEAPAL